MANNSAINAVLEEVVKSLDISPTDYERAERSYNSVGKYLLGGKYPKCNKEPVIYPQGSINLGTIVRPIKSGKESDYDIDLVCELQNILPMTSKQIKHQVGDRLKENLLYRSKLDEEGKRCWTLQYAESAGIGFHIDILPSIPNGGDNSIEITHKPDKSIEMYEKRYSNPKEFAEWFKTKNTTFVTFSEKQKNVIMENTLFDSGMRKYASVESVPDQLVRTPLQRAVQLMKRHRDIHFTDKDYKPISIIITTLAAHMYNGEQDIYSALVNIVNRMAEHSKLLQDSYLTEMYKEASLLDLIKRRYNTELGLNEWVIENPKNKEENFADRWHEDNNARAKAFFNWLDKISGDIEKILENSTITGLGKITKDSFGYTLKGYNNSNQTVQQREISYPKYNDVGKNKPWMH